MKRFSPKRNVLILCKSKVASNEATKFIKRKMKQKRTGPPLPGAEGSLITDDLHGQKKA
jgi:hypothetical protein